MRFKVLRHNDTKEGISVAEYTKWLGMATDQDDADANLATLMHLFLNEAKLPSGRGASG